MSVRSYKLWLVVALLLLSTSHAFAMAVDETNNFITLSDIHFDPFSGCQKSKNCPLVQRLRQRPASEWASEFVSLHRPMPHVGQDTNYPLLVSALASAKITAINSHAKFVLLLGDFLAHDYRKNYQKYSADLTARGYQSFVRKTFIFLTKEFANTFPTIDVYTALGNNDSYQRDYASDPQGLFYQETARTLSTLILNKTNRNAMLQSFPKAGYYAVDLPGQENLRLIVLNTVLFSYKARGKHINIAANEELDWLHHELALLGPHHQKAFIAMHIPTGVDLYGTLRIRLLRLIELWREEDTKLFQADLAEFAPFVAAIFAGHLHSDWFHIQTYHQNDEISVTGTTSISPIFANNPGYKVYQYSPTTLQLVSYKTIYFSLDGSQEWKGEVSFDNIYQLTCREANATEGLSMLSSCSVVIPAKAGIRRDVIVKVLT